MLLKNGVQPRTLCRAAMAVLLVFFATGLMPRLQSDFGDGLYDGVRGALLGASIALMALWRVAENRRRAER
jgi:hypothetical protein